MKHLRTKLIVSVALIVVVTFTSLTIGITYYAKNQVAKTNILEFSSESKTYSNDISNWMKKKINLIESCASTMSFQSDLSREDIEEIVDDHFKRDKELLNFYFGQPNSNFYQSLKDAELPKGYDPCKRDWYIKAKETKKTYVTDPYWDVLTNQMCDTVAVPVYHNKKLIGVLGIDMTLKTVTEKTKNIKFDDDVYAFLLDGSKNIIYHPDKSLLPTKDKTNNALKSLPQFKSNIENMKDEASLVKDSNDTNVYYIVKKIDSCPWSLGIVQPEKNINREITELSKISTTMGLSILVIVIVISVFVISKLVGPLKKMSEDVARVSKGDLSVEISNTNRKDEIGTLQNSIANLKLNLTEIIGNSNNILKEINNGNLKVSDMQSFPGSFNELANLINSIKTLLCNLIGQINSASSEITTGSKQLAIAADSLASHSSEQALSIQTLQNHVSDISSGIHRNSENCNLVNDNLNHLFNKIKEGNTEMETLHTLVDDIEKMSTGIQDVVETINEISFQTNILALNASVEAAHAGELGSGFAIVADEVRNLAYKSAEEANKTQELVDKCIVRIKDAKNRADVTSDCLTEIVANSSQIESAFKQISEDTNKQDEHQTRISQELDKISVGVESNTATAQETAASTSELSKEATVLSDLIQKFIV